MPTFLYRARALSGDLRTGSVTAEGERSALAAIERQGLFPVEIELDPSDPTAPLGILTALWRGRLRSETVARIARELSDLNGAGVPLLTSLDLLVKGAERKTEVIWGGGGTRGEERARALLAEVRTEVAAGADLAGALERRPGLFPEATIGIVRAGELGGFFAEALKRVAEYTEREAALRRRVRTALAYPAFLAALGTAAVIFLVTWVVPRLAGIYADLGKNLPWQTRVLLTVSDVVKTRWPWILGAVVVCGALLSKLFTSETGKAFVDRTALRIPLIRGVAGRAALARFLRTLGALLRGGVPILSALEVARTASGNREFAKRLEVTLPTVREGSPLVEPLAETGLIPPAVLEMVAVGQESATLDQVLERAGERTDAEVDDALRALTAVAEPALITIMAGIVFFIVLATLLPIFTLNQLVH